MRSMTLRAIRRRMINASSAAAVSVLPLLLVRTSSGQTTRLGQRSTKVVLAGRSPDNRVIFYREELERSAAISRHSCVDTGLFAVDMRGTVTPIDTARALCELLHGSEDLALSPDGREIAYSVEGSRGGIWVLKLGSHTPRSLIAQCLPMPGEPAWSSDGSRLAFSSSSCEDSDAGARIEIVRRNGSGLRRLATTTPPLDATSPTWSPDGTELAVQTGDAGTSAKLAVLHIVRKDYRLLTTGGEPSWSPDGRWIAALRDDSSSGGCASIVLVNASSGDEREIVSDQCAGSPAIYGPIIWTSNGSHLVFARGEEIWIVSMSTGAQRKLTDPQ